MVVSVCFICFIPEAFDLHLPRLAFKQSLEINKQKNIFFPKVGNILLKISSLKKTLNFQVET